MNTQNLKAKLTPFFKEVKTGKENSSIYSGEYDYYKVGVSIKDEEDVLGLVKVMIEKLKSKIKGRKTEALAKANAMECFVFQDYDCKFRVTKDYFPYPTDEVMIQLDVLVEQENLEHQSKVIKKNLEIL